MKIKRYKKVNRHLNFYVNNFGFRQPYQLLIDGTFCYAALSNQINIADNMPRYLQGELKLLTTQCVIIEAEKLGPKLHGALIILKQYGLHKCGHEGKPIPGAKCLLSMVARSNEKHYTIATQDRDLQSSLRNIPGVPLLYLHSKAPVLDPPSEVSVNVANKRINDRFGIPDSEKSEIDKLKHRVGLDDALEIKPKRKRKKKGPNPLSCKKKKKQPGQVQNQLIIKKDAITGVEKKKRSRTRVPEHVKEELLKNYVTNKEI